MIKKIIFKHFFLFCLFFMCLLFLFINLRINIFRYNNFDYGKFDLGNMSQMLWNTLHGRVLWLTDYFGTNLPRWAMSHVDPILLLFVPIFAIFQSPLTLIVCQLLLVTLSSLVIYKISYLIFKSGLISFLMGFCFLLYPAVGYLTAYTAFHGVTVVIPAFLGAFYIFEKMYTENNFTKKGLAWFWLLLILTMMGKEQLPLYVFLYGLFILIMRRNSITVKHAKVMMLVGFVWFVAAFFVIIPSYSHYRSEGYQKFAQSLNLDSTDTRDVSNANYFLSRYEVFGDSYAEVIFNMIRNPHLVVNAFFGGDNPDNLNKVFQPVLYMPFLYPPIFLISAPDFLINYLTTSEGVGTGEITNHRISMIIPILFLSVIYGMQYVSQKIKNPKISKIVPYLFCAGLVYSSINTSLRFNNPVYLWFNQAVIRHLVGEIAYAKSNTDLAFKTDIKIGEVYKLTPLENKDRECAVKIINLIPNNASVSGPDYLGAHLSLRETYAIFPALYNSADYVIVDVFSKKIMNVLDVQTDFIRDVVKKIITDQNYRLLTGCGNLFVFQNVGPHTKEPLFPLQEMYRYEKKMILPFFQGLDIVDFFLPKEFTIGQSANLNIVYTKKDATSLNDFIMFTTFINTQTGEIYQAANLPSFSIKQPREWNAGRYYNENIEIVLPEFIRKGTYRVFVGMDNQIRTRSIYLGETQVL